jgi:hypothetical protein
MVNERYSRGALERHLGLRGLSCGQQSAWLWDQKSLVLREDESSGIKTRFSDFVPQNPAPRAVQRWLPRVGKGIFKLVYCSYCCFINGNGWLLSMVGESVLSNFHLQSLCFLTSRSRGDVILLPGSAHSRVWYCG